MTARVKKNFIINWETLWYNEPIDHDSDVAEREDPLNCLGRGCACCGEKQRMLYSTEKSVNSTTEFVKMVVESQ